MFPFWRRRRRGARLADRGRDCPESVTLSVEDQGVGIPPGELASVFDAFVRGSNLSGSDPGGMGLGLFICRTIAERHGGRIWAENGPAGGAVFHVQLPVIPAGQGGTGPGPAA